jgi:DNA-binding NtrC family response regulator
MVADQDQTALDDISSTIRRQRAKAIVGRLCLVIIGEGLDATYPLPDSGQVEIGRSEDADIRIDHRSVSRNHALLTIGSRLTIADLGSSNGTRVRDAFLEPDAPVDVSLGEPIDIGSVMVVVQQRAAPTLQRQIWAHGYFEARLADECARAERTGGRFAVMRLHCSRGDASIETILNRELRTMDVIGYYGPAEYEVLVPDSSREIIADTTRRLLAAFGDLEVKIGAAEFPADARDTLGLLRKASAAAVGGQAPSGEGGAIVVANAAMQHLDRIVQRIAAGTISVLISGETGVGKEVLAERLHRLSPRADHAFLRLNCAALSESLLESELFGHERGAFTGAVAAKVGLLETAQGGTVFLDEIGELPMTIQVKLLRVIEERKVMRVGAIKPHSIDVRFLAATNRDLEAEIARGAFRQDLYFRLNGIALVIPPLRQRVSEIATLAETFLRQSAERAGREDVPAISPEALALLQSHDWPGNIRELRNVMERALLLCTDRAIRLEHLPEDKMRSTLTSVRSSSTTWTAPTTADDGPPTQVGGSAYVEPARPPDGATSPGMVSPIAKVPRKGTREEQEWILKALENAGGNQTVAARLLGISRRTLVSRLNDYEQVERPRKVKKTPRSE